MITHRGLVIHHYELDDHWLDKCADLGINVLGLHPPGGAKAYETLQEMLDMHDRPEFQRLLRRAADMCIVIEYEMHALTWLIPRSLFADHPDWFRMDETGTRNPDFNICPNCAEAMQYLADRSEQLARRLPTASHRYYFWPDDVGSARCSCPKCAHLSPSDQQLMLMHAILEGVRRADPKGTVPYLAYHDSLAAPSFITPKPGVFLEYAPFHRLPDRAMNDPDCEQNAAEAAHLPGLLSLFGNKDAQVLDYWLDNSMYSGWKYPPQRFTAHDEVILKDIPFYSSLGFESITSFACYLGRDYIDLYGEPNLSAYGNALSMAQP